MKYFDIKPVCPGWRYHYQMRRWVRSLPARTFYDRSGYYSLITDGDPCSWHFAFEPMNWREELELFGSAHVTFTYRHDLPRHVNCRSKIALAS